MFLCSNFIAIISSYCAKAIFFLLELKIMINKTNNKNIKIRLAFKYASIEKLFTALKIFPYYQSLY